MTQKKTNTNAFILASTIIKVDEEMINAHTNLENKNSLAYSYPELFY